MRKEKAMENDNLSFDFLKNLFKEKKEKLIIKYVFEELNEHSIIERLIEQAEVDEKK